MKIKAISITFFLIAVVALKTYSQKIELYTGALENHFYECIEETPHYYSSYSNNWGYSLGFAIDSLKFEWHTLRISVQYDNYSGGIFARTGGKGSSYTVDCQIDKHVISLSIYPVNIRKLVKKMQLSIGVTGSILIKGSFSGEYNGWSITDGTFSGSLNEKYNSYSTSFTFGIQSLINYRFRVSNSFELVPQYSFYLGLSKELTNFPESTKSMRHYFLLGLRKRIK